jgi:Alkylmercury lyase
MQDVLSSLNDRLPLADRQSGLDERLRRLHREILQSFADTGRPPRPEPADVRALAALDLVVMGEDAVVTGAYPFTTEPTGHVVALPSASVNAMCSLDAVAVAPVFWTHTTVTSHCVVTGRPITIVQDGDVLVSTDPAAPWLGIGFREVCGTASTSLCRDMVFFAGEEEAKTWRSGRAGDTSIFSLATGIDLAVAFFGPLMR